MRSLSVLFALCLVILGSSWASGQAPRGNPQDGQTIYEKQCLRCHGQRLDGRGPEAEYLIVKPTDFRSVSSRSKTDWELLITIANGVLFTPMHAFRRELTDQQLVDVLSYIRRVAPPGSIS